MPLSAEGLNSPHQRTLANPTEKIHGQTLRGHPVTITIAPAEPDTGFRFVIFGKNEDLLGTISVAPAHSRAGLAWTELFDPPTGLALGVTEHLGAALVLAGLDNAVIDVHYPGGQPRMPPWRQTPGSSLPLMDGTATPYLQAVLTAGVVGQNTPRRWLKPRRGIIYTHPESTPENRMQIKILPRSRPGFSFRVLWKSKDEGLTIFRWDSLTENSSRIAQAVARARPGTTGRLTSWTLWHLLLADVNLRHRLRGQRPRKLDFAVVPSPFTGKPLGNQPPLEKDESLHHRLLDLLGDLFFVIGWLNADIEVVNGRHKVTAGLREMLTKNPHLLST